MATAAGLPPTPLQTEIVELRECVATGQKQVPIVIEVILPTSRCNKLRF